MRTGFRVLVWFPGTERNLFFFVDLISRTEMSRGSRQFATLAMVYSSESNLFIFDSPTTKLDHFSKSFLYDFSSVYRRNTPLFSCLLSSNDGEDISKLSDSFSILLSGTIKTSHKLSRFLSNNKRECKIVVMKKPDVYDISTRVKSIIDNFDHEIQLNNAKKMVILLRKNELFLDKILKQFIALEDNGDFGPMHLLNVSTMDLIKPLICDYTSQEEWDRG